jgi:hypothetical protein
MFRPKTKVPTKKVWRISDSAPMGEWVSKGSPVVHRPRKDLPEVCYGTWVISSYDLLSGADVTEEPDAFTAELFDELFAPR